MITVIGRVEGDRFRVIALERSSADRLFPELQDGTLCRRCHSRPVRVNGRCEGCDEIVAVQRTDVFNMGEGL